VDVLRPIWMSVTLIDPRSDKREFLLGRRECEAIAEVDPAVTKRKKLHSEQVLAAKCLEPQLLSHKYRADLLSPLWGQINRQRPWPVVEPVVLERFTALANLCCEGPGGGCNGGPGISGSSTSQSFVAREMTPRRLRAAPPTTTASKPTPRSSRNRSNRSRRLREFMSISLTDTILRDNPLY
jgi:hypothetical protein